MEKPTSITVFGILNLVFGAFGLCCTPFGFLGLMIQQPTSGQTDIEQLLNMPELRVFNLVMLVLSMISSLALVASGVALLYSKAWGRTVALGYGAYAILAVLVTGVVQGIYMYPALIDLAGKASDPAVKGGAIGGLIGSALGSCFGFVYPVLLIIFMNRPNVKAYLLATAQAGAVEQPLHPLEGEMQQPPSWDTPPQE